jgi:signal transduction histidine kinase
MGLVNPQGQSIGDWQAQDRQDDQPLALTNLEPIPLEAESNLFIRAVLNQHIERFQVPGQSLSLSEDRQNTAFQSTVGKDSNDRHDGRQFGISDGLVLPLVWGVQPVGVLLIDLTGQEKNAAQLKALEAIAQQTAVSLGMMMTRVRRAKESAIQEERTRIALDLHDTVSQSLFGLVYTLQGTLKIFSEDPQAIRPELEWALTTAEDVRQRIRATIHNMWPEELTAEKFEEDLRTYTVDVLQATELEIAFDIRGEFNTLSPPARRGMYRICQESLTNIVHHAAAHQSRICVDVADGRARFILRDNGRGFEPSLALAQTYQEDHFGLRGMRERAAALGGTCEIYSQLNAGTSIIIDIPANAQAHHE